MNERLKDLLVRHEGIRTKPYKCSAGKNTIGVGRNFDANPLPPVMAQYLEEHGVITIEMVDRLLDADIAVATGDCMRLYPDFDGFTENRQIALIDFIFNIGRKTALQFQVTNKAINDGRWDDAARGLTNSRWYKQVGKRSVEIVGMIKEG